MVWSLLVGKDKHREQKVRIEQVKETSGNKRVASGAWNREEK